jgi:hypothetical protein
MQGQDESTQSSVAGGWRPAAGGWDIHMHPLSSAGGAGRDDSSSRPRNRPRWVRVLSATCTGAGEQSMARCEPPGCRAWMAVGEGSQWVSLGRFRIPCGRVASSPQRSTGPLGQGILVGVTCSPRCESRGRRGLSAECGVRSAGCCLRLRASTRPQPQADLPRRASAATHAKQRHAGCGLQAAGCGADGPDCRVPGARPLSTFFFFTSRCHAMMRARSRRRTRFAALRRVI